MRSYWDSHNIDREFKRVKKYISNIQIAVSSPLLKYKPRIKHWLNREHWHFTPGLLDTSPNKEPVKFKRQRALLWGSKFIWEKYEVKSPRREFSNIFTSNAQWEALGKITFKMYKGREMREFIKGWNWDRHKSQLLPPVRDIYIRKWKSKWTIRNEQVNTFFWANKTWNVNFIIFSMGRQYSSGQNGYFTLKDRTQW